MPSPAPAVILRGTFDDLGLFDALQLMAATSQTGVLRIGAPFRADVHLSGGAIGCVRLDGFSSPADALLRAGLVDAAATAGEVDVPGVVMGAADPEECRTVVREHVLEVLFELSVLGDGGYDFLAGVPDPWRGAVTVDVAVALAEHERRVEQWREIAGSIPPMTAVPGFAPHLPPGVEEVAVGWAEWRLLVAVDGRTRVSEVVAASGMPPLEACRALHQLVAKGLLSVDGGI